MSLGSRINEIRREKKISIDDLCEKSGVPKGTLSKITAGITTSPTLDTVKAIARALGCRLDDLDDEQTTKKSPSDISEEAHKVAKDYDGLDRHGRNVTRILITEEQKRMAEEKARKERGGEEASRQTRLIPLYYTPAAAGMTSPAAGEDFDYIEVDSSTASWKADFAVKIDGDSMEPYLQDGSTVFVNREPLENGDVGIFYLDGEMLCKQYYKDEEGNVRLLSLNRARRSADRFISHRDSDTLLTYYGRVILPRRPLVSMA